MKVLVVGGAGYIGSYMGKLSGQQGCSFTTLDDLCAGYRNPRRGSSPKPSFKPYKIN